MTVYQVTPTSLKQPGTWESQTVQVTGDEGTEAVLWLRSGQSQKLEDEPSTTTVFWAIQRSDDGVSNWIDQVSTTMKGNNGIPWYKPPRLSTNINGLVGKFVKTVTITNEAFRFGIDLEVL